MAEGEIDLCIVGGGPAGMVAGLLFARAGVRTTVLEKHADFLRDFRGDTVHPSTLRIFSELGLLDRLLERPHDKVHDITAYVGERRVEVADFSRFDRRWNFIAMIRPPAKKPVVSFLGVRCFGSRNQNTSIGAPSERSGSAASPRSTDRLPSDAMTSLALS